MRAAKYVRRSVDVCTCLRLGLSVLVSEVEGVGFSSGDAFFRDIFDQGVTSCLISLKKSTHPCDRRALRRGACCSAWSEEWIREHEINMTFLAPEIKLFN